MNMKISRITRDKIVDYLLHRKEKFYGDLGLLEFLDEVFDLNSIPSLYDHRFESASGEIWQHMINNHDWDDEYLLKEYLKISACDDEKFILFVETCLHADVCVDEKIMMERFFRIRKILKNDKYDLIIESIKSNLPTIKVKKINDGEQWKYDVALSFASEQREYVGKVAEFLKQKGVDVFYDKFEEVGLWGEDLSERFARVYGGEESDYCVVFISKEYAKKAWTKFEFRHALANFIKKRGDFILPARFDDTEIESLPPTICFFDLRGKTPDEFGEIILRKLFEMIKRKSEG
ncbi:MAG: TIR domain-containing protein [Candidatus Hydrogenedentes bacterium]|nr:TIR domain-containing protein [Candidatus Hydrogenedentota bacterium]